MKNNLSYALGEAVQNLDRGSRKPKLGEIDKKLNLFSLTQATELFQNEKGITIKIDRAKDKNLTEYVICIEN